MAERDIEGIRKDVQHLLRATSIAADETIMDARKRLRSTFGRAGEAWEQGANEARRFVKGHAYETALVALFAGIAAGYLLRRNSD